MGDINISDLDIIRAWKNEEYRSSLTEAQRAQLPDNPAGIIDLADEEMATVHGGFTITPSCLAAVIVTVASCTKGKGCDIYTWGGDAWYCPGSGRG